MLNKLARGLLVCTSVAPILLTYAFMIWTEGKPMVEVIVPIAIAFFLVVICLCILHFSASKIQFTPFSIISIGPADGGVLNFIVAYLLPLMTITSEDINYKLFVFIFVFLVLIVWTTNTCSINPLLSLAGYHFYQVTTLGQVSCLLISREVLINVNQVTRVVKLTEYIALHIQEECNV